MTINQVVNRFRYHGPRTEVDAMIYCRVPLRHIDSGAFRNVYQVGNLPLVAKFPYDDVDNPNSGVGKDHALAEFAVIGRLRKRACFKHLRQYLPRVYWMDALNGVSLVHQYTPLTHTKRNERLVDPIEEQFSAALGISEGWDSFPSNFGVDETGKVVLLDMGCLE